MVSAAVNLEGHRREIRDAPSAPAPPEALLTRTLCYGQRSGRKSGGICWRQKGMKTIITIIANKKKRKEKRNEKEKEKGREKGGGGGGGNDKNPQKGLAVDVDVGFFDAGAGGVWRRRGAANRRRRRRQRRRPASKQKADGDAAVKNGGALGNQLQPWRLCVVTENMEPTRLDSVRVGYVCSRLG